MLGDLGTFCMSHKHHSGHKQGTPFPAFDLSPKANNHSAPEAHICHPQAGTCSGPAPLPGVPGPPTPVPQPRRQTALSWEPRESFWLKHLLLCLSPSCCIALELCLHRPHPHCAPRQPFALQAMLDQGPRKSCPLAREL